VGAVLQFRENLELTPLAPLSELYNFSVNESPTIDYEFAGAESVGKAYRFYPEGVKFEVPIRVTLPLNCTGVEGELFVIARDESGNITFIVPEKVDWDSKAVTFLTPHFSVFEPYEFPTGYPHANVIGSLYLDGNYDESPTTVYFDFFCANTVSNDWANFVVPVDGITSYRVLPPIPDYLFGTYDYRSLIGCSENFLFSSPHPYPSVVVSEVGATYSQDFPVVATTSRLTWTVRDADGDPVEGARIKIHAGEGLNYVARSRGDGSYTKDFIGLVFDTPTSNMKSTFPYSVTEGEPPCDKND
jgi:hypothetical protein